MRRNHGSPNCLQFGKPGKGGAKLREGAGDIRGANAKKALELMAVKPICERRTQAHSKTA